MPVMIKKLGTEGGPKGQDKIVAPNAPFKKKPRKALPGKMGPIQKARGKGKASTYKKGGKVATPKTKTQAFADYKKKHGRHHKADPRHPMNSERTGPSTMKKMAKGGKLKMVEKNGKKVPFYAADGVGKMAKGGNVKIKSGDTLSQIAKSKGISLKALLAANPSIKNANKIRVGQSIKIPGAEAGKAAKTSNPYKGMSRVQMADMDVKNKSEKRQRTATRSMQTQAKMGTGMTPTPSKAKATIEKKSGREAMLERARRLRDKKIAASKKMGGGSMKKAQGYKHGGKMCRGGGAATRGKSYGKAG